MFRYNDSGPLTMTVSSIRKQSYSLSGWESNLVVETMGLLENQLLQSVDDSWRNTWETTLPSSNCSQLLLCAGFCEGGVLQQTS